MARRSNSRSSQTGAKKSAQNPNSNSAKAKARHSQGAAKSSTVEIYTASFCPHCQDAKMYMKINNIKFTEHNLERSKGAEKKFLALGGKKIPLILVKGKILRSWNQEAFEKAYKS